MGKLLDEAGLIEFTAKVKSELAKRLDFTKHNVLTEAQKRQVCNDIGALSIIDPKDFKTIQLLVRAGVAPQYLPIGSEITVNMNGTNTVWVVRSYDYNPQGLQDQPHNMVLEMKYLWTPGGTYRTMQFDAPNAFYYADEPLPAGTYHFTTIAYGGWLAGTYQFTLTKQLPAGGQLQIGSSNGGAKYQDSPLDTCYVCARESQTSTALYEAAAISVGNGGTDLGTWGTDLNHPQRVSYGSNNYWQSALRQWIISDKAYNQGVWTPQTKYDRPPSWFNQSYANGFMYNLDPEFLSIVKTMDIPCRTNNVFETIGFDGKAFTTGSVYTISDKFFLLSRPEIYGTWDSSSIKDGEQLDAYKGLLDIERIKYDANGSAHYAWLRSRNPSCADLERIVINSTGAVDGYGAYDAYGVALACVVG